MSDPNSDTIRTPDRIDSVANAKAGGNKSKSSHRRLLNESNAIMSPSRMRTNALVFSSPSKLPSLAVIPATGKSAMANLAQKKAKNVGYKPLVEAGTDLAGIAASHSNEHQNAVLTMLVGMKEVMMTGNYNPEMYASTALVEFVRQLQNLGGRDLQAQPPGMPKTKRGNKDGRSNSHRLGSIKSSTNNKLPGKCTFCGGGGKGGIGEYHKNRNSCQLKDGYGICLDVKAGIADLADDLDEIAINGQSTFGGRHLFVDALKIKSLPLALINDRTFIDDELPKGTKRIQIRAFLHQGAKKYFLCTCIDSKGKHVRQDHGLNVMTYHNVFVRKSVVITHVAKCDFIFYDPLSINTAYDDVTEEGATTKAPPESNDTSVSANEGDTIMTGNETIETDNSSSEDDDMTPLSSLKKQATSTSLTETERKRKTRKNDVPTKQQPKKKKNDNSIESVGSRKSSRDKTKKVIQSV